MRFLFMILVCVLAVSPQSRAEIQLTLTRRIAVFPIAENNSSTSEDAWWQMRELLTRDQKFLIASKRFMINRGVFQPRKGLRPADSIILGKILDAQALITTWVEDRRMHMKVYDGENGSVIWEGEGEFHPAVSIPEQLGRVSQRLINDFLAALPYHAYQVVDEAIGKAIYEENSKKLAQVYLGANGKAVEGDTVQWIRITGADSSVALLNSSPRITIVAEGTVVKVLKDKVEVELTKISDLTDVRENALVRFPKEVERLKDLKSDGEKTSSLGSEYLSNELKNADEFGKETHPTMTALAFILNIAGMILLAF